MQDDHRSQLQMGTDPDEDRVLARSHVIDLQAIPRTQALVDGWIRSLTARTLAADDYMAPTSCAVHRRSIRVWLRYLVEVAHTDQPSPATVAAFRTWAAQFRRPNTVNSLLESVRLLYRWSAAQGQGAMIANGVENIVRSDGDEAAAVPRLSDAEFTVALRTIAGDTLSAHRDRALLAALRSCPVDTIAFVGAKVGNLNRNNGRIQLVPRWRMSRWKRGDEAQATVRFDLTPAALGYLKTYLRARGRPKRTEPLFAPMKTGKKIGKQMSALSMRLVVLRTLVAAGLRAPAPGVDRHARMFRYPTVSLEDLNHLEERLPTESSATERERLRAIVCLLAMPDAMLPLDRIRIGEFSDDGAVLTRPARGSIAPKRHITLPEAVQAGIRPWLAKRRANPGSPWLFPRENGNNPSHHVLKRLAWSLFRDRLPSDPTPPIGAASRRIRPIVHPAA